MCIFYFWCAKCNSKWLLERDRNHVQKAERMERPQKTEQHLKFSAQYGCGDKLMRWLICLAFMWQLCFLWGFRLRVAPLSLSPSCVTHYKTSSEHLFPRITLNRLSERGNTPGLITILYVLWKAKAMCGMTSLRVTVLALFYESVKRGTKTIRKSKKQQLQQIGQMK